MRYILNNEGYIETISFNNKITCNDKSCTEYTGTIPDGYTSLVEWAENANIRAYKLEDGNLVFNSFKNDELNYEWTIQQLPKESYISCIAKSGGLTTTTTAAAIGDWEKVPLEVESSYGNGFTLVDNQIVVGPGVNAIEVSVQAYFITNVTNGDVIRVGACLNNSSTAVRSLTRAGGTYITLGTPIRIVPVSEGDVIDLRACNGARTGTLISSGADTFISIRKVS